jgi:hypothetical protein
MKAANPGVESGEQFFASAGGARSNGREWKKV